MKLECGALHRRRHVREQPVRRRGVVHAADLRQLLRQIGDGCGRKLDCGGCTAARSATSNICVDPGCVPLTCNAGDNVALLRHDRRRLRRHRSTAAPARTPGTCGGHRRTPERLRRSELPEDLLHAEGAASTAARSATAAAARWTARRRARTGHAACPPAGGLGVPNVCPGLTTGGARDRLQRARVRGTRRRRSAARSAIRPAQAPLYNVIVYVPNAPLIRVPEGVSCDRCSVAVIGQADRVRADRRQRALHADVEPVPPATNIPLVIQVGKWRRQITVPTRHDLRRQPDHQRRSDAAAAHQRRGPHPAGSR